MSRRQHCMMKIEWTGIENPGFALGDLELKLLNGATFWSSSLLHFALSFINMIHYPQNYTRKQVEHVVLFHFTSMETEALEVNDLLRATQQVAGWVWPQIQNFELQIPYSLHCSKQLPQLLTSMVLTLLICKNETFGPKYNSPFQLKSLCLMNHWLEGTWRNHLVIVLTSSRILSKLF